MNAYTVRFEIEVRAITPRQAATVVRDMMLDPDAKINVDVFRWNMSKKQMTIFQLINMAGTLGSMVQFIRNIVSNG